jgi:signal transduction histidine kinase
LRRGLREKGEPVARDGQNTASWISGRPWGGEEGRSQDWTQWQRLDRLAALGTVVTAVAHELNNPLMVISGQAELLARRQDLPEPVRHRLEQIVQEALRCGDLVRHLLSFARKQDPDWQLVDLRHVVARALDLLAYRLRALGVEISEEAEPDCPAVYGDAQQLEQVFLNLIINAQQALEQQTERRLVVRTHQILWPEAGARPARAAVQVMIRDTGPGIPLAVRARLFEPFFTTKREGTGLGLAVSRGIVERHHGRLYAESREGEGTTFYVELPVPENEGWLGRAPGS